jgi:hypothetical protein
MTVLGSYWQTVLAGYIAFIHILCSDPALQYNTAPLQHRAREHFGHEKWKKIKKMSPRLTSSPIFLSGRRSIHTARRAILCIFHIDLVRYIYRPAAAGNGLVFGLLLWISFIKECLASMTLLLYSSSSYMCVCVWELIHKLRRLLYSDVSLRERESTGKIQAASIIFFWSTNDR